MRDEDIRVIPDAPDYGATPDGRIWSSKSGTWREVKTHRNGRTGYLKVALDGRTHLAHRVVLSAFWGPCPEGMQARHLNGKRDNNGIFNLAWGTWHENWDDRISHGTANRGERSPRTKLTNSDVLAIRSDPRRQVDIAADYGIKQAQVSRIKLGTSWAHITPDTPSGSNNKE